MTYREKGIAVVGMGGVFPDAPDLDQFWTNLKEGVESIRALTDDDLEAAGVPPQVYRQPNYVRSATVLDGIDQFDAEFFGYSPREAELMDPQHRIFLESGWSAMEDAGQRPGDPDTVVGVFASVSMNSYLNQVIFRNPEVAIAAGGYQLMLGNDKDFLTTRLSYKLDLQGPSMVVQTACSSSLVAVEVAVQSLLRHQCDVALAGGSSVSLPQKGGYLYQEGMIFSPDGHCRPFDAQAVGIRAGHGAGVVVLKRLEDAVADRDPIRSIILGAAINNDGAGKVGYTAPSVEGQAQVIAMAHAMAGVEPDSLGYVEAHGTGTRLGDPIEVAALSKAFRNQTDNRQFCGLGSVKSNIGHLDSAAGIASLIKTVLSLENKQLPPSLNYSEANPELDIEASPFFVNDTLRDWSSTNGPRRAGVSSFGIGGTNAHVVLEEAPNRNRPGEPVSHQVLVVSAKSPAALDEATSNLNTFMEDEPGTSMGDLAFTSQVGRVAHRHRRALVADSIEDGGVILSGGATARILNGTASETKVHVAYMFSGQGSQYPGMGLELYGRYGVFKEALDQCAEIVKPTLDSDLREMILKPRGNEAAAQALGRTALTQPSLFAIEYAMARLWMAWGVNPDSMIGHSIGEWVAAHLAGVFSLEDALSLVTERGRLMEAQPSGVMFSVSLPEQDVRSLVASGGCIAAVNGPSLCTVSGTEEEMAQLATSFQAQDVPFRELHTSHAFHSEMMDPVIQPFKERVASVEIRKPEIPFISNVTGTWIEDDQAMDPAYWAGQIRAPVRFLDGVRELAATSNPFFLEVGPGQTLTTFARQSLDLASVARVVPSLPHAKDDTPADRFTLEGLARLWLGGLSPDWEAVHGSESPQRIRFPTYPFQRKKCWIEPGSGLLEASTPHKLANDLADFFYAPSWIRSSKLATVEPDEEAFSTPWLIFDNGSDLGAQFMGNLRKHGTDVIAVSGGDEFLRLGESDFCIDPSEPDHYDQLLTDLRAEKRLPLRIVHWWTGPGEPDEEGSRDLAAVVGKLGRGFFSLLYLSQALGRLGTTQPMRLTVVTRGTASVLDPQEVTHPENATLMGPCSVLPLEAPWIDCRLVDLPGDPGSDSQLPDFLLREAILEQPASLVAYRRGQRWEPFFEELHLEEPVPNTPEEPTNQGGVYLITGGLGSLGRAFARHLAESGPCVLALLGRSKLPPEEEWEQLSQDHPEARLTDVIRDLRGLAEMGATVVPLSADVSNETQMSVALRELTNHYGPITGVIHAAGLPGTGVLQMKTPEMARTVLDPKVRGTLILNSLVGSQPLEFFVLFSSINSILPAPGGADYCAANAFLDAFATYRRAKGDARVLSLNWDTWSEEGMAVDAEVPAELQAARDANLRTGLTTSQGIEAFDRGLQSGLPQLVVSRKNVPSLLALQGEMRSHQRRAMAETEDPDSAFGRKADSTKQGRPDLPQTFVAPRSQQEELVARVWQELLGIEPIGIHDNFFDLGGHSLLAIRVLSYLQERTGLSLSLEAIFEAPTIEELSERIETLRWMAESGAEDEEEDGEHEEFLI